MILKSQQALNISRAKTLGITLVFLKRKEEGWRKIGRVRDDKAIQFVTCRTNLSDNLTKSVGSLFLQKICDFEKRVVKKQAYVKLVTVNAIGPQIRLVSVQKQIEVMLKFVTLWSEQLCPFRRKSTKKFSTPEKNKHACMKMQHRLKPLRYLSSSLLKS